MRGESWVERNIPTGTIESRLTEVTDLNILSTSSDDRVDGEMGVDKPHLVLESLLIRVWIRNRGNSLNLAPADIPS